MTLYSQGDLFNAPYSGYTLFYRGDQLGRYLNFQAKDPANNYQWIDFATNQVTPDQWHHVDVVVDRAMNKIFCYFDGQSTVTASTIVYCRTRRLSRCRLPPPSPNLNAHLERFFGSLMSECLDRLIFFGEQSLRTAVREYLLHYHGERHHQGLGNKIPLPGAEPNEATGPIECRERLGGLLRYYYRRAAYRPDRLHRGLPHRAQIHRTLQEF